MSTRPTRASARQLSTLAYVLCVYAAGVSGVLVASVPIRLLAALLLAHALVLAAYLVHECAHNSFFASRTANRGLGEILLWLVGAGDAPFEAIRRKHLRHHADRADVISTDHRAWLVAHPRVLAVVAALEWAWIPAVDLLLRAWVIVRPFGRDGTASARRRVLFNRASRLSLFALIGWIDPAALVAYGLAALLFLHVMRFMDVHQHTFLVQVRPLGAPAQAIGDRDYEQRNTYSNPLSPSQPWLNALVLNFGFHNAHHVRPSTPWFALPRLHEQLFGDDRGHVLPFPGLLRGYHRHRLARILGGEPPETPITDPSSFVGASGVSFLIAS